MYVYCRYSAKSMPKYPTCGHRGKQGCRLLTMQDIKNFHEAFYFSKSKEKQDAFILKYCTEVSPKKKTASSPRNMLYNYYVLNAANNKIQVCRKAFLDILGITKHRVLGVFQRFRMTGSLIPHETRGGDRKRGLFQEKEDSVIAFIKTFKGIESHYGRGKSRKTYLPSELNITKMFEMYNNEQTDASLKVKQSYFRMIFSTRFNLSFSAPLVDVCSTCLSLSERQQEAKLQNNEKAIEELDTKKKLHLMQANSFFNHLREQKEELLTISFDMQKNLPLPKVPDQTAYYSRQLYCYNLAIVTGPSSAPLNKKTVSIFTWGEHEMQKSSNQIASAVFHELGEKCRTGELANVKIIRLVADGCAGQNKNINLLTMVAYWMLNCAPQNIESIELVFPITGHSFLPADRVFGLLEKEFKKINTITEMSEYHEIFAKFATVKKLGKDWKGLDWRTEAKEVVKTTQSLHFAISKCRRLILHLNRKRDNILVSGELAYNTNIGKFMSITKKGKTLKQINPLEMPIGCEVNSKKLTDVKNLLTKHFGEGWQNNSKLKWYSNLIDGNNDSPQCECADLCEDFFDEVALLHITKRTTTDN